jgi:hypothetical protein
MPLINRIIEPRAYETIRDRIGAILAVELLNQEALTYDELFNVPVFVQRSKPVNQDEDKIINVSVDSSRYSGQTTISSNGEYTFFIDVVVTGESTTNGRGDVLTAHKAQRLAGVVCAILEDPQYITLGFQRPFIGRSHVMEITPGTIERGEATELNVVRITMNVQSIQSEVAQEGIPFVQNFTSVYLAETEFGFQYVGGQHVTPNPPTPTCLPVRIFRDDILIDTIQSGGAFYYSNSSCADADWLLFDEDENLLDSGSIVSGQSANITAPNAKLKNSDNSWNAEFLSGSDETTSDVRIRVFDQNGNSLAGDDYPSNIPVDITVEIPPIEVEANVINSLDEIVNTATLTPSSPNISAPNGHSHIKKSGGGNIDNVAIPSGATVITEIDDSVVTLKDSGGSNISVTNVQATETANITAPDGAITVNGSSIGGVKSNGLRALFVKLNGINSGVYNGVDTINVTSSDAWVRNPDWLPLDTVTAGSQKFSGLFAVYETQKNVCTIQITTGTRTINWGDGTTQSATSGTLYTKVYDYATISSPVITDEFGFNYKMVVVNIPMTSATQLYIDRNTSATLINNGRSLNWLDIALDCSTLTLFAPSQQAISNKLQRLLIYNVGATIDGNGSFLYMNKLKVLKFPFAKLSNVVNTFSNYFGDVRDESNNPIDFNFTIANSSFFNLFVFSFLSEIGTFSAPSATSGQACFQNNTDLVSITSVNMPSASNLVSFFDSCVNLESVVPITITSTCSNISNLGLYARKCKGFIISNCSGITNTNNAFFSMVSMETLILTGMTRGFTIDDCNMSATAIDALFTSLGNAVGSQTINVRRNPGSATCTTSIATSKGYTVVIA